MEISKFIVSQPEGMLMTRLAATIGPPSNTVDMITKFRALGVVVMRVNFSVAAPEFLDSFLNNLEQSYKIMPYPKVAVCVDTQGPEIRTGSNTPDTPMIVGDKFILCHQSLFENAKVMHPSMHVVTTDYEGLVPKKLKIGDMIYIDDGYFGAKVTSFCNDRNYCVMEACNNATVMKRKGVNIPGSTIDLPPLTTADVEKLDAALMRGVCGIMASFTQCADDVRYIRNVIADVISKRSLPMSADQVMIVAKIESMAGLDNLISICELCDAVCIARGDLGAEIPVTKVGVAQKMIASLCNNGRGISSYLSNERSLYKPVMDATQMLDSMITSPRPTRAEVTDCMNAVLDGCGILLLSGETGKGSWPLESINTLRSIALEAEKLERLIDNTPDDLIGIFDGNVNDAIAKIPRVCIMKCEVVMTKDEAQVPCVYKGKE